MNVQFDIISKPKCQSSPSLQLIDSDFSNKFQKYDTKFTFSFNEGEITFKDDENHDETFFKRKIFIGTKNQGEIIDDIIDENIIPKFDEIKYSFNTKGKLDFSLKTNPNLLGHFQYHPVNLCELSNFEFQLFMKEKIKEIEPTILDNYYYNSCSYDKKFKEKYMIPSKHELQFDLNYEIPQFSKFALSIDQKLLDEMIFLPLQNDANYIESDIFIPGNTNPNNQTYFDAFLQSMKIDVLKFDLKCTKPINTFSQTFLTEIPITKRPSLLPFKAWNKFDYKNADINQPSHFWNITEEYSPMMSASKTREKNAQTINDPIIEESALRSNSIFEESEIPTDKLPCVVQVNELLFSEEDVAQFEDLYKNLKFVRVDLNERLMFIIDDKIANFLIVSSDDQSVVSSIANLCTFFDMVVVTTTQVPTVGLTRRVKWRCITSHSQISSVVMPYLAGENEKAADSDQQKCKNLSTI